MTIELRKWRLLLRKKRKLRRLVRKSRRLKSCSKFKLLTSKPIKLERGLEERQNRSKPMRSNARLRLRLLLKLREGEKQSKLRKGSNRLSPRKKSEEEQDRKLLLSVRPKREHKESMMLEFKLNKSDCRLSMSKSRDRSSMKNRWS